MEFTSVYESVHRSACGSVDKSAFGGFSRLQNVSLIRRWPEAWWKETRKCPEETDKHLQAANPPTYGRRGNQQELDLISLRLHF